MKKIVSLIASVIIVSSLATASFADSISVSVTGLIWKEVTCTFDVSDSFAGEHSGSLETWNKEHTVRQKYSKYIAPTTNLSDSYTYKTGSGTTVKAGYCAAYIKNKSGRVTKTFVDWV